MPQLTIVGLGPGAPHSLTIEAKTLLDTADELWLRTRHHPLVDALPASLTVRSFDDFYERGDSFQAVYEEIAANVLALASRPGGVVYGVPGSPWVGETTVRLIVEQADMREVEVRIVQGMSFLEPTIAALTVDALDGLQIVDATALAGRYFPSFEPDRHTVIAQLYDRYIAADVKLVLLSLLPPDHVVTLVEAAGTRDERLVSLPVSQLDHHDRGAWGLLTSLYVPPYEEPASLSAFMDIIAHLRSPDGCPWDRAQDHRSLRPYLLEESYETLAALDADDPVALCEELGDLLLQIALHAQIASEGGHFTIADVLKTVSHKMIRRHPHVFGDVDVTDADEVVHLWDRLKREEKGEDGTET